MTTMDRVIIRLLDLPCKIRGFVRKDPDGDYNIYINAKESHDIQLKTLEHELDHISQDDFNNDLPIHMVEGF